MAIIYKFKHLNKEKVLNKNWIEFELISSFVSMLIDAANAVYTNT